MATLKESKKISGVLGIKLQREAGVLRRWEPAVRFKERSSRAGEALIEKGFQWLRQEGADKAVCKLKYQCDLPETEVGSSRPRFKILTKNTAGLMIQYLLCLRLQ